ncbi:MAG: hypothetical protein JSW62_03670, partial [Thermoplasmatales archaeon]
AVPTAVFNNGENLFSYPLLFYQDEYDIDEDKDRSLNARQGLDYFMEDWMGYCNGKLDAMTLINVPENKLDSSWKAREYTYIDSDDIYEIAGNLVLGEWSYSDDAVIAVIEEEFEKPDLKTEGELIGTLEAYDTDHKHFLTNLPDIGTAGTWTPFDVTDERYKYITMELSWYQRVLDFDLQLYNTEMMQVDNAMLDFKEHLEEGNSEVVGSYIPDYGTWRMSVTAVPKKGIVLEELYGDNIVDTGIFSGFSIDNIRKILNNQADVDVYLYPGTIIDMPPTPPGCRNVELTLKCNDADARLGFTIIDSVGTEICSSVEAAEILEGKTDLEEEKSIEIVLLGETDDCDNYQVIVFSLDDLSKSVDFTLEYSWEQKFFKREIEGLAGASNAAVLASKLNSPLLYVNSTLLPDITKEVLNKLGTDTVHLVNLGDHLDHDVIDQIKKTVDTIYQYSEPEQIYSAIKKDVEENDIVFTTVDPWTYWHPPELKPVDEYPAALFIGPAAYISAHHQTPPLVVDMHPCLSQAVTYHTHFWNSPYYKQHIAIPNSANMARSSRQAYKFLEEYNLGKLEKGNADSQVQETIITVAGQYDIGITWDRAFTGAALNGRFTFSPVDTAYWISRNVFYPAIIFQNPGMQENLLWQGSESTNEGIFGTNIGFLNRLQESTRGTTLRITKPTREEAFEYPVLQTYADFIHEFNAEASKHWNFKYERADGVTPGEEFSPDPIDDGIVKEKSGAYYPDLDETHVIPLYCERANYDNVYSSNFEKTVENLNRGVLMWMVCAHGGHVKGGGIKLWDSNSPYVYEENPWRVYETPMVYLGNIRELVRWFKYSKEGYTPSKISEGLISLHILPHIGSTEHPDTLQINPQLRLINKILKNINFPTDFWGATGIVIYRDRIKHPLKTIQQNLPFFQIYEGDGKVIISPRSGSMYVTKYIVGPEFDDALENLHSCGLNAISCLPAGTYLHMTWTRHGMVYQIIDPWTTTDWSAVWEQMLIKRFAMGDTVGQAYERGMRAAGPEYTIGQFWWDRYQNVELFGDPDLRVFVPGTEYSDLNYWEQDDVSPIRYDTELDINGHMPFGVTEYPNERQPKTFLQEYIWIILVIIIIIILIGAIAVITRKKK